MNKEELLDKLRSIDSNMDDYLGDSSLSTAVRDFGRIHSKVVDLIELIETNEIEKE
jgi:hypothetical protein